MKHLLILIFILMTSCGQPKTNESVESDSLNTATTTDTVVNQEIAAEKTEPETESEDAPQDGIRVTAFLVYENGELSSFDIINDEGISLWNTIIGEGSAEASSHETKVIIYGNEKEIDIVIKNDDEISIDKSKVDINGQLEIVVPDTGCGLVEIILSRNGEAIYQRTINFDCGE